MTVLSTLSLARDLAALLFAAIICITAALAYFGAAGLTGPLTAALATIAISGLVTLGLHGAISAFFDPPGAALAAGALVLAVGGGAFGAYYYGVRGAWVGALGVVGVVMGVGFVWAFARRFGGSVDALGPIIAYAGFSLALLAALSATARAANDAWTGSMDDPSGWTLAQRFFATPPAWFDCGVAPLVGDGAARPGLCAFNAPQVEKNPPWSKPIAAPENLDNAPNPGAAPKALSGLEASETPAVASTPALPEASTPDFVAILPRETSSPSAPGGLSSYTPRTQSAPELGAVSAPDTAIPAPDAGEAPGAISSGPLEDAPRRQTALSAAQPSQDAPSLAQPQEVDAAPGVASSVQSARTRTEFVCFPMLGAASEQLCPDDRLSRDDFEVSWRGPSGLAVAAVGGVECYYDPSFAVHTTLLINLSGELIEQIPRSPESLDRVRKIDAVYDMTTRLIGAARALGGEPDADGGALMLSMYFAGGSKLLSPWAESAFGPDQADRLFEMRSSAQTLALLRRIKSETQNLRRSSQPVDLAETLGRAFAQRPVAPLAQEQSLIVLVTDAATPLSLQSAARLKALKDQAPGSLLILELGADEPSANMRALAETFGGEAFAAATGADMAGFVSKALRRARSFCALRVSAPESFFDVNTLEVKLRRNMTNGCVLEQVAHLDCNGVSTTQRIDLADDL